MSCDQKVLGIKIFVSRSFDLIEDNWECETRAVKLGCLCKAPLRGGCDTFAKSNHMEKLEIRAVIEYFCKKGMSPKEIHEYFMETLVKESPYSSKKWTAEFKTGRESVEDDGRSGRAKDTTADENVKVVHTMVMCDRRRDLRSIASEVDISFREVQSYGCLVRRVALKK